MSQLRVDPKILSWGETYDICDMSGEIKYQVSDAVFSIGNTLVLYDKTIGREKGMIERKFFRIFKTLEIKISRKPQGTVKKRFFFLKPRYILDFRGWRIEGDIDRLNYSIYENTDCVARITRDTSKQGNEYILEIDNEQNEVPAIMVAMAMYKARGKKTNETVVK